MGKVYTLYSRQHIPASLSDVWKFFSDANNLLLLTPPHLNLKVTSDVSNKVYAGQVLLYKVKPVLGITLPWMTEIRHVQPLKYFVDEQRKGPYKLWHHQHHFKEIYGGVQMIDIVHYRLSFGWIGRLGNSLFVKKELKKIFAYRHQKLLSYLENGNRKMIV
jgi:ligand-binding SRPBCC domain-containing protein